MKSNNFLPFFRWIIIAFPEIDSIPQSIHKGWPSSRLSTCIPPISAQSVSKWDSKISLHFCFKQKTRKNFGDKFTILRKATQRNFTWSDFYYRVDRVILAIKTVWEKWRVWKIWRLQRCKLLSPPYPKTILYGRLHNGLPHAKNCKRKWYLTTFQST